MAIEKEKYENIIDAYEKGVGVEPGQSLTDYIKRENIKIKEIDMDDMDDESGIKSLNKNMAGMGGAMKYFETPYGFDRAAFEDAIIQFQDYQDSGGDLGFHDFVVIEFFGIVKKEDKAPSIKMASETPEEEFDMMMESEILGEFDEYKKNNPGKTFDDFMKIKSMQMSEAPDDTKTILKLMEDNNMSFEEASNFLRIEKSRKNKPKEPVEPKKIKLAEGGLSYLMGM